jgi:hypothetical protein
MDTAINYSCSIGERMNWTCINRTFDIFSFAFFTCGVFPFHQIYTILYQILTTVKTMCSGKVVANLKWLPVFTKSLIADIWRNESFQDLLGGWYRFILDTFISHFIPFSRSSRRKKINYLTRLNQFLLRRKKI